MKTIYREISHPAFPYCKKHNRLFPHYTVGWLTPARPEELITFQAQCDVCRQEAAILRALGTKSANSLVRDATAS
jgi:hypothetical protein